MFVPATVQTAYHWVLTTIDPVGYEAAVDGDHDWGDEALSLVVVDRP